MTFLAVTTGDGVVRGVRYVGQVIPGPRIVVFNSIGVWAVYPPEKFVPADWPREPA